LNGFGCHFYFIKEKQLDKARHRRIEARERRQESLHNRGVTVENTSVKFPQPKNMIVKEVVKLSKLGTNEKINKLPDATVQVKRGRGRPRKESTENISTKNKAKGSAKKPAKITKGRK
jgi:hypothetical protein